MRHEFPWVGTGFIHAVADGSATDLAGELEALGCRVYVLRGQSMQDPPAFWNEFKTMFNFPSYFGSNWDAFNDSFGDLELGSRTVVMWRRADLVAATLLKLFVEAIAVLHRTVAAIDEFEQKQLILIVTGDDESFPRPELTGS